MCISLIISIALFAGTVFGNELVSDANTMLEAARGALNTHLLADALAERASAAAPGNDSNDDLFEVVSHERGARPKTEYDAAFFQRVVTGLSGIAILLYCFRILYTARQRAISVQKSDVALPLDDRLWRRLLKGARDDQ